MTDGSNNAVLERDDPHNQYWLSLSFDDVRTYLQTWLDHHYPAEIFPPSDAIRDTGRDPGAQLTGTLRAALDWYRIHRDVARRI